jgi:hypothetical protein
MLGGQAGRLAGGKRKESHLKPIMLVEISL